MSWSWPIWYVGVFIVANLLFREHHVPFGAYAAFVLGSGLGFATWYWHWRAVWKRMWELYEQEQSRPVAPPPPGPVAAVGGKGTA